MPRRRRYSRKPRRRIYAACEGGSERGYVALVRHLAENQESFVYLDIQKCNRGDPQSIVEFAVEILTHCIAGLEDWDEYLK